MNWFARVFDQMARMGLAFKSDPIHVIQSEGREFGSAAGGFELSIAPRPDQKDLLSVILRNTETVPKKLVTHGWLHFLTVRLMAPDGSGVPLSPYGREALKPERAKPQGSLPLGPNEMIETELPLGVFYEMNAPGEYRVSVSCQLPSVVLTSNECTIKHS
jgi:hypothetical protein